jgi:hypothetical protein
MTRVKSNPCNHLNVANQNKTSSFLFVIKNKMTANVALARQWISEVFRIMDAYGPPEEIKQRHELFAALRSMMYLCHREPYFQWIFLQELTPVLTVHSIATHSSVIQVQNGPTLPVCFVSILIETKLLYVYTWGCATCTSRYFKAKDWNKRLRINYHLRHPVVPEYFQQLTCQYCQPYSPSYGGMPPIPVVQAHTVPTASQTG